MISPVDRNKRLLRVTLFAGAIAVTGGSARGQLAVVERLEITGVVESAAGGRLTVRDAEGRRHEVRVQAQGERGVALADGRLLEFPAAVRVTGGFDLAKLKPGQVVTFAGRLNGLGRSEGELPDVTLVDAAGAAIGVTMPAGAAVDAAGGAAARQRRRRGQDARGGDERGRQGAGRREARHQVPGTVRRAAHGAAARPLGPLRLPHRRLGSGGEDHPRQAGAHGRPAGKILRSRPGRRGRGFHRPGSGGLSAGHARGAGGGGEDPRTGRVVLQRPAWQPAEGDALLLRRPRRHPARVHPRLLPHDLRLDRADLAGRGRRRTGKLLAGGGGGG